jgi:accessory gene regulator B
MIAKLAENMAIFYANKSVYEHDQVEVYKYGFELLISTLINCFNVLIISILLGTPLDALLFMVAFIPLRTTAGGYHARHHWSCILAFNAIFFVFSIFCKHLAIGLVMPYALVAVIISSLFVWSFSPVEAVNKPLTAEKRERNRKNSVIITCINMVLVIVLYYLPILSVESISFYVSGALTAGLLLPVTDMLNTKAKRNKYIDTF